MADIAWSDVTAHAPGLSTVDSTVQTDVLAYVNQMVDPEKLGGETSPRYRLARIYLAAHLGTVALTQASAAAGPVVSETVGEISRSYGFFAEASGQAVASTGWGREYLALIRRCAASRGPLVC